MLLTSYTPSATSMIFAADISWIFAFRWQSCPHSGSGCKICPLCNETLIWTLPEHLWDTSSGWDWAWGLGFVTDYFFNHRAHSVGPGQSVRRSNAWWSVLVSGTIHLIDQSLETLNISRAPAVVMVTVAAIQDELYHWLVQCFSIIFCQASPWAQKWFCATRSDQKSPPFLPCVIELWTLVFLIQ